MLARRRREAAGKRLHRLPDTITRLVSFTITARTAVLSLIRGHIAADSSARTAVSALPAETTQSP